jgi:glycosyltransferase involved in cell wall biosynthesis
MYQWKWGLKRVWMNNINVLHFGIKYWPYDDEVIHSLSLKGIRGGGMNKYCDMLINGFPPNIKTVIFCQRLKGQKKIETIGNVNVYRISTFGNRTLRQMITNIISFFYALIIVRREKINLLHGHMLAGISIAFFLSKILRKPVIGTPYSFVTVQMNKVLNKTARFLDEMIYKRVDVLVFESEENRKRAYDHRGLMFSNSVVVNTGISSPPLKIEPKDIDKYNILYLGRLVKIKAIENLILSFLYLNNDDLEKVHLNIVGEGELYDELNNLIVKHNLASKVTLHGYVESNCEMFICNDIFVLPSHQEGLSISLMEAMSYGLACIINNFGVPFKERAVFEMLDNSPETIALAISRIINDKSLFNDLRINGLSVINENYSIEQFVRGYCKVYENLVNHSIQ